MGTIFRYFPLRFLDHHLLLTSQRRQLETYSKIHTYRLFFRCCSRLSPNTQDKLYSTSPKESPTTVIKPKVNLGQAQGTEEKVELDIDLINHLERTSLVDFGNEEALRRLQEAIRFADTMLEVDTTGVEPLTSILEEETLYLREDKACPTNRDEILANASVTEEDYFVAPPGNIPLEPQHSTKS